MSHYQKFEIPTSWVWTNIGELLENRDAERVPVSSIIRKKQSNKIYDYYGAAGVIDKVDGYLFDERLLLIGEDGANLLSRAKDNAFFAEGKYWVNNHAHILDSKIKSILDYVAIVVNSYNLEPFITGSAQPKLSQDNLNSIPIPLPPLAEQKRILFAIQTAMEAVARINIDKAELSASVTLAKSKILELAMQGKLVPQDPADEPAADMLRRINPKARIITDNPHYPQLPDNWVLTTIESVCNYGKCISVSVEDIKDDEWILELEDIEKDTGKIIEKKNKACRRISGVRHQFNGGDVLYSKLRTYLNKVLLATEDGYCTTEIIPISCNSSIHPQYLCLWLRSPYFLNYTISCGYGVKMPRLSTTDARNGIVPLPPLEEQKHIVQTIHKMTEYMEDIVISLDCPK